MKDKVNLAATLTAFDEYFIPRSSASSTTTSSSWSR